MTRKTALQLLLCCVGYPAMKAQDNLTTNAGPAFDPDSRLFIPSVLSISFDYIKEIHLVRDGKKVVVKMSDIWDALEEKK